jgi:hypothetical protein
MPETALLVPYLKPAESKTRITMTGSLLSKVCKLQVPQYNKMKPFPPYKISCTTQTWRSGHCHHTKRYAPPTCPTTDLSTTTTIGKAIEDEDDGRNDDDDVMGIVSFDWNAIL